MKNPEALKTIIPKTLDKIRKENKKHMAGRYLITGVQLGIMKFDLLKLLAMYTGQPVETVTQNAKDDTLPMIDDNASDEVKAIHDALKSLYEVHDQFIGNSKNELPHDINDMRNLWASWCGEAATDTENEMFDSYFTLYWRDGKREIVKGTDIADAMTHAGYGHGALKALDFHCKGVDYDYEYSKEQHKWILKNKE